MIQVTQAPQGPIQLQERFTVAGTSSPSNAGRKLTIVVDDQFTTTGSSVNLDGSWRFDFLFQQAGNRRLRVEIGTERAEITVQVVTSLSRLSFAQVPPRLQAGQATTVAGKAEGYDDGAQLLLRADQQYELARPVVQADQWQAVIGFNSVGKRLVEIIGSNQDRAETTIEIIAAPPRPPRLRFTNPPKQIKVEQAVSLVGEADEYSDGDQLILRADQKLELARPVIRGGKWSAAVLFRESGKRLIEIIGSEQDRAQTVIDVVGSATPGLQVLPRSSWTSNPSPSDLPNLQPRRITLHHTALSGAPSGSATQAQEAARMRVVYNGHVNGNGWADIGYHFIIMPSGRVFEARSERKRGAHDIVNDGLGVAFDGIYTSATISQQQYATAVALCTLLCQRYGFKDPVTPVPTPTADFGTRNLPLICGHRDRVQTECPGTEGGRTVRLPEIRQAVKARL